MSVVCLIDDDESDDDKEMLLLLCPVSWSAAAGTAAVPPSLPLSFSPPLMSCSMTPSCEALTAVPSLCLRRLLASVVYCAFGRVTFLESNDTFWWHNNHNCNNSDCKCCNCCAEAAVAYKMPKGAQAIELRRRRSAGMESSGSKRRQQMNLQHLLLLWQLLSLFLVALSNNYVAQANQLQRKQLKA